MGRAALNWVLEGGKPQRGSSGLLLAYRWHRFWFDRNLQVLDSQCRSAVPLHPPVFIVGPWRSGTTFLHELFAANQALLAPTTWQCMNSSMHLLNPPPDGQEVVVRPMDGFVITNESPQEDEFALLAQGIPSVYLAFFDPRRLTELTRWLEPRAWTELPQETWWPRWRTFLTSVQGQRDVRLLLKSPNHTFRMQAILGQLPESSFVWILRDPRHIFLSNIKMWKAMIRRYALWSVDEATLSRELDSFLTTALELASRVLLDATARLPRTQLVVVRYEELLDHPSEMVEKISDRLALPMQRIDAAALQQVIARGAVLQKSRYDDCSPPNAIESILPSLLQSHAAAYATHGVAA